MKHTRRHITHLCCAQVLVPAIDKLCEEKKHATAQASEQFKPGGVSHGSLAGLDPAMRPVLARLIKWSPHALCVSDVRCAAHPQTVVRVETHLFKFRMWRKYRADPCVPILQCERATDRVRERQLFGSDGLLERGSFGAELPLPPVQRHRQRQRPHNRAGDVAGKEVDVTIFRPYLVYIRVLTHFRMWRK